MSKASRFVLADKDKDRFWSKVSIGADDKCWPWTASIGSDGYGHFKLRGKVVGAHIVAFVSVPPHYLGDSDNVMHTCDVTICCNPKHHVAGTHLNNMQDRSSKNRSSQPRPGNGKQKITDHQRFEIKKLFDEGMNKSELGRLYNVTPSNIRYLLRKFENAS